MNIERYDSAEGLLRAPVFPAFRTFLDRDPQANFFQSLEFLEFIRPLTGFRPVLFLALDVVGNVEGSVLGVYQRDGIGVKAWMSRRLIVWGGPLGSTLAADALLDALLKDAKGNAIYAEFRNRFDTHAVRPVFERHGCTYGPHLNFLIDLEGEEAAMKKLDPNKRRQVRNSLAAGATCEEVASEEDLRTLYGMFTDFYSDKVRKPLPHYSLFQRFHTSQHGCVLVVKHGGRVIGGSLGPVYRDRESHQWFAYGDNTVEGVHASVLATWAHIAYAARSGYKRFDFMGAGKPGQGYGVHEFKSRFGGTEVEHGRYTKVLNRPLYMSGSVGLVVYHRVMGLFKR